MATHRDPVCGMNVDTADQHAESNYGGSTYYFCSENCKQRFDANPTAFGADSRTEGGSEQHEPGRTTTGNMTSPMYGSAGSGGAEFEPVPEHHKGNDKMHEA